MNSTEIRNSLTVAAIALLAATSVVAQQVVKFVDADGRATYSDRPAAVAPEPADTKTIGVTRWEVSRALANRTRIATRSSADIDTDEASLRLVRAQIGLERGLAPLAGEQVDGATTDPAYAKYWLRQDKLTRVVEKAQARADESRLVPLARR
jgi:hypothetical protein